MSKQFPVRFPDDLAAEADAVAKERGLTISAFIREAVRDHLDAGRRAEQSERLEERLAATAGRTTKELRIVRNDLHIAMAYFDCFVRAYYVHTPPVPAEALRAAAAAGDERYAKFQRQLAASLQGGDGFFDQLASISGDLDGVSDES